MRTPPSPPLACVAVRKKCVGLLKRARVFEVSAPRRFCSPRRVFPSFSCGGKFSVVFVVFGMENCQECVNACGFLTPWVAKVVIMLGKTM